MRCPGCFNPHFWGKDGGYDQSVAELIAAASSSAVEGVTLLGGEPFDQASAAADFAHGVRQAGLSVMTFTGFTLEHLEGPAAPSGSAKLLATTDLLVDGPYRSSEIDVDRPWVGSRNQRFHFLTDRYQGLQLGMSPDRLEVRVKPNGEVSLNGWSDIDRLDTLLEGITPPVGRGRIR